jgi:hypothetical protein
MNAAGIGSRGHRFDGGGNPEPSFFPMSHARMSELPVNSRVEKKKV